jgi:hypothetical protein
VLNYLEKNTNIRSDGLKNNSYTNLNSLFEQVAEEGDDQTWKGNFDFLELLNKTNGVSMLKNKPFYYADSEAKSQDSEVNSKLRR